MHFYPHCSHLLICAASVLASSLQCSWVLLIRWKAFLYSYKQQTGAHRMSMKQVVFLKPLFTWPLGAAEQAGEIKIFWPASLQLHLVKTKQNKQKLNKQTNHHPTPTPPNHKKPTQTCCFSLYNCFSFLRLKCTLFDVTFEKMYFIWIQIKHTFIRGSTSFLKKGIVFEFTYTPYIVMGFSSISLLYKHIPVCLITFHFIFLHI